jgi:iron complex transport system substrate-binding protein
VPARILIALVLAGVLAGCQESGFDESRETQRPLKVQHALDELTGTKVPGLAERPLTLTYDTLGDTSALGLTPVAALIEGGRPPAYLRTATRGVEVMPSFSLGEIESAEPDVILGAKEFQANQYDELRKIAPTVMSEGYDWKLNLRLHGEALGRTNDAEQLLVDWDNRVARVRDQIGDRDVSVELRPLVREVDLGPDSFAAKLLAELGIEEGDGGREVVVVRAGQEWVGTGGLLGARAALAGVAAAL